MPQVKKSTSNNGTSVIIEDSYAEAFTMRATRLILTAPSLDLAMTSASVMTGFATSVIGCGVEAGIAKELKPEETPDGRPGVKVIFCAVSTATLTEQVANRAGQCVLTAPGTALYSDLEGEEKYKLGDYLRYFGDGWQTSKNLDGRRIWRIPVMDGEFCCDAKAGLSKAAVGGGNLLIMGENFSNTLRAAQTAVAAMKSTGDVILPFPGGIVRSGSKVGSKYKGMNASTNNPYCPTLRGQKGSQLQQDIGCVLEIVIDALTGEAVSGAMSRGLKAIIALGPNHGARRVTAGNYGGKLGTHLFHLRELV